LGRVIKTCGEIKHKAIDALYSNYHDSPFLVGHRSTPKVSCNRSSYKSWEVVLGNLKSTLTCTA
jgi:hypothetical protein